MGRGRGGHDPICGQIICFLLTLGGIIAFITGLVRMANPDYNFHSSPSCIVEEVAPDCSVFRVRLPATNESCTFDGCKRVGTLVNCKIIKHRCISPLEMADDRSAIQVVAS
jgi:hypothetical protein